MVNTILYFGSFNPVHLGHTAIAEYLIGHGFCDELWMVVSPHNPLKERSVLVAEQDRLAMVRIAVAESRFSDKIKVSDVEFSLPKPSYTIDTLKVLEQLFPWNNFSLLIGSDNVDRLDKWKDYQTITTKYKIWVYPRQGSDFNKFEDRINVLNEAPLWDYSSTQIRHAIEGGESCEKMVCKGVIDYITEKKLWTKEKFCKAK